MCRPRSIRSDPAAGEFRTSRATQIPPAATTSELTDSPFRSAARARWLPSWAALIARINQKLGGNVGFINPQIYALAANSGFNDITVDDNKCSYHAHHNVGYAAGVGWDACTGLGTPIGAALANLLKVPAQEPPAAASRRVGVKRSGPRRLEAAGPASRPPRSAQHRRKLRAGRRHAGVNSPLKLSTETLVQAAPSQGFSTPSAPAVRRRRR